MDDYKEKYDVLRDKISELIDELEAVDVIEETGQRYKRVCIRTIFDNDYRNVYTILEDLKKFIR